MVKTAGGSAEKVFETFKKWPKVIGMSIVAGEWDLVVWIDAADLEEVYRYSSKVRKLKGVVANSSHWVREGWKNAAWWWQKPAGAWVWWRAPKLDSEWTKAASLPWTVSTASVPGHWDGVTWISGKDWDAVSDHVLEFQRLGWETKTLMPLRTWWNKSWKDNWWN